MDEYIFFVCVLTSSVNSTFECPNIREASLADIPASVALLRISLKYHNAH